MQNYQAISFIGAVKDLSENEIVDVVDFDETLDCFKEYI
jgi:hypothetical protein